MSGASRTWSGGSTGPPGRRRCSASLKLWRCRRPRRGLWRSRRGRGERRRGAARAAEAGPVGATRRHNLPAQLTSFVGRERELAELAAARPRRSRAGPVPPAGDAHRPRGRRARPAWPWRQRRPLAGGGPDGGPYPDGVWLVELAALADPALVPRAVAAALGVRRGAGAAAGGRAGGPRSAGGACCWCWTTASTSWTPAPRWPTPCCARAPTCACWPPAARRWGSPASGLARCRRSRPARPDGPGPAAGGRRWPAPGPRALFVDRAAAVAPRVRAHGRTTPGRWPRSAARLDGLPLALELAAARVRVLSVEQLLRRLEDRFRLLDRGQPDGAARASRRCAPPWTGATTCSRQRSGRCSRRLAVFAGGWTLEAAEAGVRRGDAGAPGGGDVLELLTRLVDTVAGAAGRAAGGRAALRLLETLRQYALERLQAGGRRRPSAGATRPTSSPWPSGRSRPCTGRDRRRRCAGWTPSKTTCAAP